MKNIYILFMLSACATHNVAGDVDAGVDLEDVDAGVDLEDFDAGVEQLEDLDAGVDLEDLDAGVEQLEDVDAGVDLEDLDAGVELGCCFYFYEVFDNPDDYRPGDDIKYNICRLPDSPEDKIPHCED